jgi:hypothetical protein
MSTRVLDPVQLASLSTIEYPASDGQPMAETEIHVLAILYLIGALRLFFGNVPDIYVIGNIFLYYVEGKPSARCSPDVIVVKGVE